MELLKYKVKDSKQANLDLITPFEQLHELLEEANQKWMRAAASKTAQAIIECKVAIRICKHFIVEDNFKAAFHTLTKDKKFVERLEKCFHRDKEKKRAALQLWEMCLKNMMTFQTRFKESLNSEKKE